VPAAHAGNSGAPRFVPPSRAARPLASVTRGSVQSLRFSKSKRSIASVAPLGSAAPENTYEGALLVRNEYDNVSGIYIPHGENEGSPAFANSQGCTFLYKVRGYWCIGSELGGTSYFEAEECPEAQSPLEVPAWSQPAAETRVTEFTPPTFDYIPSHICLRSKYSNVAGGYQLEAHDQWFWAHPVFYNEEDNMYLWCDVPKEQWLVGPRVGRRVTVRIESPADLPTRIRKEELPDEVEEICEVTWKDAAADDDLFVDTSFPASDVSLGSSLVPDGGATWIRAPDINRDQEDEVLGEVKPTALCQGRVGDCWLISAVACVAEFPDAIRKVFKNVKRLSPIGRYELSLYSIASDGWETVVVDDLIPCERRAEFERFASPLFAKSVSGVLWPLLIEKAFAKLVGSYENLDGGLPAWAWQCLTGEALQYIYQRQDDGSWQVVQTDKDEQRKRVRAAGNGCDKRQCPFFCVDDTSYSADDIWSRLQSDDQKSYVMGASCDGGREEDAGNGLVTGHAYSLISARDVSSGVRLVCLRNPWGNDREWNGDWSDKSPLWDENPEVAQEVDFSPGDDGLFWMAFEDFITCFSSVSVSPRSMKQQRFVSTRRR